MDSALIECAQRMWAAYSQAAGGVTFDGKPLPTWETLGDDRQKCWVAAAQAALEAPADFKERVRIEHRNLETSLSKLGAFVLTPAYNKLPDAERERLWRQRQYMEQYAMVLGERIEAFSQ